MNARVSMFADAFAKEPKDCDLAAVIEAIRVGRYAEPVTRLRQLRATDPDAYQLEKRKLPAFCVSGTAASRTEPRERSGVLQVDLDALNGTLETVREKVKADPCVLFGFVSPSGDGLKLGVLIDGARHLESFFAAEKYFRETYGVKIDPAVNDRLRLCFVSHDPEAWTNEHAEPLPIPERNEPIPASVTNSATPEIIVLPSGGVSISESARAIFQRIAPTRTLFWRGGALVELVETDGISSLAVLKPEKFCSDVEKLGQLFAWRAAGKGDPALKPSHMNVDLAKRILAASEAREFLPSVASVLQCPVLIETKAGEVAILGKGYHPDLGGLLIVAGDTPPKIELAEAVASLHWLVEQFDFQTASDRSRALAEFITPELRLGGHLPDRIPIDFAEGAFRKLAKDIGMKWFARFTMKQPIW